MAESKPTSNSFDQALELVSKLSPDEQERLVEVIKLQELQREIMIGVEQLQRGEKIPAEQVFQELQERHKKRIAENK